jgi:hypothetical protein
MDAQNRCGKLCETVPQEDWGFRSRSKGLRRDVAGAQSACARRQDRVALNNVRPIIQRNPVELDPGMGRQPAIGKLGHAQTNLNLWTAVAQKVP